MDTCKHFAFDSEVHVEVVGSELLYDSLFNHTATLVGGKIYLIGGFEFVESDDDGTGEVLSRYADVVQMVDWTAREFHRVQVEGQLPPRQLHTATLVGDLIYVMGGATIEEEFEDVWVLDTVMRAWREVDVGPTLELFGQRYGHAAAYIAENEEIVIFGGSYFDYISNKVTALSFPTHTFYEPRRVGNAPPARFKHASCMVGRAVCFFGGQHSEGYHNDLFLLHPEGTGRYRWSQPVVIGWRPAPRYSTDLSCIGNRLYCTGGKDENGRKSSELLIFDLETNTWEKVVHDSVKSPGVTIYSHSGDKCVPVYQHRQVNLVQSILLIGGLGPFIEYVQELKPAEG